MKKQQDSLERPNDEIDNPISWEPSLTFVKYAIASVLVGAVAIFTALRLLTPDQTLRAMGAVMVFLVGVSGWYLLWRGRIKATINVLAYGVWTIVTGVSVFTGGVRAPAIIVYPVIILMIGWMISSRAALFITGLSLTASFGFLLAESWSFLPRSPPTPPALYAVVQVTLAILSLVLIGRFVSAYQDRIRELRRVSDALARRTQDLEATKQELTRAQAVGNIGSWVYDLANDTMRLSAETCRIFGLPEGTTGNHGSYLARTYAQDRGVVESAWQDALSRKAGFDHEHRIVVGDEIRWVRQKAEFDFAEDGTALGAEGIVQDITERKEAENIAEQFHTVIQISLDGFWITDSSARILDANESVCRMLGYSRDELLRLRIRDIEADESPEEIVARSRQMMATGHVRFEARHRRKDGAIINVEISVMYRAELGERFFAFVRDITERKRAEETIKELNRDFVSFLENTSDFIYFKDQDSRFRFCSQTLADITGHPSWRDMIGKTDVEVFPCDTAQIYREEDFPIFREGKPLLNKSDFYYDTAGKLCWASTSKWPLLDQEGKVVGLFGISRDVSALKEAEDALRDSEEFFRLIAENIGDFIAVLDLDGRRLYNSPSYKQFFGTETDLHGTDSFAEVHPEDQERVKQIFRETIQTGIGHEIEYRFVRPDGGVRLMESLGGVIRDSNGRVARVVVVSHDITERKQAEQQLRIAAAAFESQEGMAVTDPNNVVLRINRAFSEITGYTAEEAVGRNMNFLKSDRHDADFYAAMWKAILSQGAWQGEIWNRIKNGEVHPHWLTISEVRNGDGVVTHYVGTYLDITERKRMEEQVHLLAFYDPLSRLPNRRLLNDRLSQTMAASKRSGCYAALMFLDLDNFKPLNDAHGHGAGDLLLVLAADRLKSCVRETDTVARFGGDEFVVMISELDVDRAESVAQADHIAEKIRSALSEPYLLTLKHEGEADLAIEHHCTVSIGVTLFIDHEASQDDILKWADKAMYQAKNAGRNAIRFYDAKA
jgi:diguanylate cyclase (GGDEF)-like protein/PAS domain S-box-containing protein